MTPPKKRTSKRDLNKDANLVYDQVLRVKKLRRQLNKAYDDAFEKNILLKNILRTLVIGVVGIYTLIVVFATYWYLSF